MGEVLRARAQVFPVGIPHGGGKRELACQEVKLLLHAGLQVALPPLEGMSDEPGHAQEQSLHLDEAVAVLARRLQGDGHRPALEGVAIEPEAEIAAERYETGTLPVTAKRPHAAGHLARALLHALGQQPVQPAVHPQRVHGGKDAVATGKLVGVQQRLVVLGQGGGHGQHHLRNHPPLGCHRLAVGFPHHMQDDTVISRVAVVTMAVPVGRAQVQLHVAGPQDAVHQHLGVEEVGAAVAVVHARVYHIHAPAAGGAQAGQGQDAVLPDVMQQFLHTCKVMIKCAYHGP